MTWPRALFYFGHNSLNMFPFFLPSFEDVAPRANVGVEESKFLEGSELPVNSPLSLNHVTWNQCRSSKVALSPQDGMFDGKQPEKGNISRCLSPVMRGSEAWCEREDLPIALLEQSPSWKLEELAEVFSEHCPFPQNKVSQTYDWCPEVRAAQARFCLALWRENEPCVVDNQGPILLFLCSPRPSLHWHSPASSPHVNLQSGTSKLSPTLAPGWHVWAKLWIKTPPVHSHSLSERRVCLCVLVCVCVSVCISSKLYKFNICPRKWRTKQKSNKNCNPKLGVGERL